MKRFNRKNFFMKAALLALGFIIFSGCESVTLNPVSYGGVISMNPLESICEADCLSAHMMDFEDRLLGRAYFRFDLTSVPISTVKVAILQLNPCRPYPCTSGTFLEVFEVLDSWNCNPDSWGVLNWHNQPGMATIPEGEVLCNYPNYMDFDITNLVQGWVDNPATNYGIVLKVDEDASSEFTFSSNPELFIEFE